MIRITFTIILCLLVFQQSSGQRLIKAEELVNPETIRESAAYIDIQQDIRVDSLLSRHISANGKIDGISGFRIQIYRGSHRRAREEANEARSEFISEFPETESYLQFANPNYFKVRVGNYRTKHDAFFELNGIKKKFPDAYIVTDIIKFPVLKR